MKALAIYVASNPTYGSVTKIKIIISKRKIYDIQLHTGQHVGQLCYVI